jgi:hypothetical protein
MLNNLLKIKIIDKRLQSSNLPLHRLGLKRSMKVLNKTSQRLLFDFSVEKGEVLA